MSFLTAIGVTLLGLIGSFLVFCFWCWVLVLRNKDREDPRMVVNGEIEMKLQSFCTRRIEAIYEKKFFVYACINDEEAAFCQTFELDNDGLKRWKK